VKELKDMGVIGDLSERYLEGERRGAEVLEDRIGNFAFEEGTRELVGEFGKGKV
jgi:hypothetical protein